MTATAPRVVTTGPHRPLVRSLGPGLSALVWPLPVPMQALSSAPHGGGWGRRSWVLNAQVPPGYKRTDPGVHLAELADGLGLRGPGVGMLTAVDVRGWRSTVDGGVHAHVTVGLTDPCPAAAPDPPCRAPVAGTVNVLAVLPHRLSAAALVNAVATVTEAKCQALWNLGLAATGTPSDAVCLLCPTTGPTASFGGPRSPWGARLARAVHRAVLDGGRAVRP